jgi:16S rRNA A1518/A1519 N6-dimethyltransferase RsmA/KsgA/DIM1 with predicted DNA glycosylase/AP lyase activity
VPGPDGYFDERIAARYDEDAASLFDPAVINSTADFLADLAGEGRALEFGIGTGRIALPLSERGVDVFGIELSRAMVAKLREKPGAERIDVAIGDFTTTAVKDAFSLVYVVFNSLVNLTTLVAQMACFLSAAVNVDPGG